MVSPYFWIFVNYCEAEGYKESHNRDNRDIPKGMRFARVRVAHPGCVRIRIGRNDKTDAQKNSGANINTRRSR